MAILDIVIGLVFAFLLFSLLGTILQELTSTFLSLRGRVLLDALIKMIEQEENKDEWKDRIKNSSVYKKYVERFMGLSRLPSYLSSDQVIAILQDIMESAPEPELGTRGLSRSAEEPEAPVMRDVSLKNNLQLLRKAQIQESSMAESQEGSRGLSTRSTPFQAELQEEVEKAKRAVAKNFNEMMDRASGWYKERIQLVLLLIGLGIAVSFDADTFEMYHTLSDNPEARQQMIAIAGDFVSEDAYSGYTAPADTSRPAPSPEQLSITRARLDSLIAGELEQVKSPLGIGRTSFPESPPPGVQSEIGWRARKLAGWVVTALAISLGAPFWFDLLNMLMNIRGAGQPPKPEEEQ